MNVVDAVAIAFEARRNPFLIIWSKLFFRGYNP